MANEPLVSVVTPVYNGEQFIAESIRSVLGQTYANWTHTILDNASTDATPEIVAEFAATDERIRYRRFEEFVDVNASYNRAFASVDPASEYCKLVAADDWIYPECLERMVAAAEADKAIGMVSSYRLSESGVDLVGSPYPETRLPGLEVLRGHLLGEVSLIGGPTSLLIRSSVVRDRQPFYDPKYWHADFEASFWGLTQGDFASVNQVLTFERRQSGRIMERAFRMNTLEPEFICFLLRYGPLALSPGTYRRRLRWRLWRYVGWHLEQLPRPSRLLDPTFFALHEHKVELILGDSHGEPDVRLAMSFIRLLLARGRWHREQVSASTDPVPSLR